MNYILHSLHIHSPQLALPLPLAGDDDVTPDITILLGNCPSKLEQGAKITPFEEAKQHEWLFKIPDIISMYAVNGQTITLDIHSNFSAIGLHYLFQLGIPSLLLQRNQISIKGVSVQLGNRGAILLVGQPELVNLLALQLHDLDLPLFSASPSVLQHEENSWKILQNNQPMACWEPHLSLQDSINIDTGELFGEETLKRLYPNPSNSMLKSLPIIGIVNIDVYGLKRATINNLHGIDKIQSIAGVIASRFLANYHLSPKEIYKVYGTLATQLPCWRIDTEDDEKISKKFAHEIATFLRNTI